MGPANGFPRDLRWGSGDEASATHSAPPPSLSLFSLVTLSLWLKMGRLGDCGPKGLLDVTCPLQRKEGERRTEKWEGREDRSRGKRTVEQRKENTIVQTSTTHRAPSLSLCELHNNKMVSLAPFTMRKPRLREVEQRVFIQYTHNTQGPNQYCSPNVAEMPFPPLGTR